jgi:hypothetical protein
MKLAHNATFEYGKLAGFAGASQGLNRGFNSNSMNNGNSFGKND